MQTFVVFDECTFRTAMAQAGFRSVARLSRRVGVSESYGLQISHGLIPSTALRQRFAALLGVHSAKLWRVTRVGDCT